MNTLTHTRSHSCQAIGLHATLLQIDEMVICGLCGSQIEEELQPPKEFPEELAGTLRHLLQTCRLSINQIPHAKREIRYGQNTVESHIGLDHRRRDESWVYLNEIKPQLDDLCIDLKWFVLDGRRYQSEDTPTSAPGSISVPNRIHKSLQPFMHQGFKFTFSFFIFHAYFAENDKGIRFMDLA